MRAVFVNYTHPSTPHISGVRVAQFGNAFAEMGHRILLLTRSLNGSEPNKPPEIVADEIRGHDWSRPYHLECSPRRSRVLNLTRNGLPGFCRKPIIFWYFLRHSGVFHDWVEGTRPYWNIIAETFQPELTWGTFFIVAQGLARAAGIPWVMDVKDGWDPFILPVFRKSLVRRFSDSANITANSQYLADLFKQWFEKEPTVVYSGVPRYFLDPPEAHKGPDIFRVTLIGSVYSLEKITSFFEGVRLWLSALDPSQRANVRIAYAGKDARKIEAAAGCVKDLCTLEIHQYLDLKELFRLCSATSVNAYIWYEKTFHHKVIELFCCRRPVIAFSGERQETFELARQAGSPFFVCKDENDLAHRLNILFTAPLSTERPRPSPLAGFSWTSQAQLLQEVLKGSISRDCTAAVNRGI